MQREEISETRMNEAAVDFFDEMLEMIEILKGKALETDQGSMIMDLGIKAPGGYLAGEYVTQVCMGGLAEVSLTMRSYGSDLVLPTISVMTDFPWEAALGSQFAGWSISKDGYRAMGSGPARILARKPKKLFKELSLTEKYDKAVIVLEAAKYPPNKVLSYIAESCEILPENLHVIIFSTASITGSTQISGRAIESGIHKLFDMGMDVGTIISAWGSAPIAPLHSDNNDLMMGRTNDMLIYGSEVFLQVDYENDKELLAFLEKAVSCSSKIYGALFYEIFEEVGKDFYKIDPAIFSPAKMTLNNIRSGKIFSAGEINQKMIMKSIQTVW